MFNVVIVFYEFNGGIKCQYTNNNKTWQHLRSLNMYAILIPHAESIIGHYIEYNISILCTYDFCIFRSAAFVQHKLAGKLPEVLMRFVTSLFTIE